MRVVIGTAGTLGEFLAWDNRQEEGLKLFQRATDLCDLVMTKNQESVKRFHSVPFDLPSWNQKTCSNREQFKLFRKPPCLVSKTISTSSQKSTTNRFDRIQRFNPSWLSLPPKPLPNLSHAFLSASVKAGVEQVQMSGRTQDLNAAECDRVAAVRVSGGLEEGLCWCLLSRRNKFQNRRPTRCNTSLN